MNKPLTTVFLTIYSVANVTYPFSSAEWARGCAPTETIVINAPSSGTIGAYQIQVGVETKMLHESYFHADRDRPAQSITNGSV